MIADAGIAVVVAQDSAREEWRDLADHVVRLTPAFDAIDRESERNPDVAIDPHNLAYSIWTSGSTGKPKGAMNTHASLMNILRWMEEAHPLRSRAIACCRRPRSTSTSRSSNSSAR